MIEVLRAGQYSTLQDLGRFGFRAIGVPVSGPMDRASAIYANQLLGNDVSAPLIEMSFVGASFLFHKTAVIAVTGAECQVYVDNKLIKGGGLMKIEANTTVKFGAITSGNFLYLAISGGFRCELVLGSASYFSTITEHSRLIKGQQLHFNDSFQSLNDQLQLPKVRFDDFIIPVERGPEFEHLSEENIQQLLETKFSTSNQSNRMGFRLNERVNCDMKEIISSPVQPGTVQLTSGGQLIVLMRDAQTMGGYTRIFQLTDESINYLAQMKIGKQFQFRIIHEDYT